MTVIHWELAHQEDKIEMGRHVPRSAPPRDTDPISCVISSRQPQDRGHRCASKCERHSKRRSETGARDLRRSRLHTGKSTRERDFLGSGRVRVQDCRATVVAR